MSASSMKVIKVQEAGKASVVDAPLPKLRDDYILVKVHAVGLNPTGKYQLRPAQVTDHQC